MGIEPYTVAGTLRLVIAQRLVKKICDRCKERHTPDDALLTASGIDPRRLATMTFFHGRGHGCTNRNGRGYKGREAVPEILEITEQIRRLIAAGRSDREIAAAAKTNPMKTLRDGALDRVREGITTLQAALEEA